MKVIIDIVGVAVVAFLLVQFIRGLTLSRTDGAGEGPDSWSVGSDGSGHDTGGGHGT